MAKFLSAEGREVKITAKILADVIIADQISQNRDGNFVFRRGYFYRHGMDSSSFARRIENDIIQNFPGVAFTMLENGDHWAPFRGGDTVKQGSHFWVVVNFHNAPQAEKERDALPEALDSLHYGD